MVGRLAEVAKFFGVARNTVKGWRHAGMPGTPGAFDLAAIARWDGARARPAPPDVDHQLAEARAIRESARAARAELALKRERAAYIATDEHARRIRCLGHEFTARLERYPAALAAWLSVSSPAQWGTRLEEYFRRELEALSKVAEQWEREWAAEE